ncbi:hypothetical protein WMY93_033359 [Mugilogobius chulae]|uniref:Helicase ATP-binding domain-containing protein n=1 Tax=Mugilogobius chulae TaxID=88201 RepID=A0AAW0MI92_9GOBI
MSVCLLQSHMPERSQRSGRGVMCVSLNVTGPEQSAVTHAGAHEPRTRTLLPLSLSLLHTTGVLVRSEAQCSTSSGGVAKGKIFLRDVLWFLSFCLCVTVWFNTEDGKPLSILQLNVQPTPHVVDQTFRLYHPENSFLKKSIRLPPWDQHQGAEPCDEVTVHCSDPDVVCQTRKTVPGEPQDVYLKVPGSPSPHVRMFYVMLYTDKWQAAPCQVWQVYVHFLERVDMSAVSGQRSCQSLVLRGKHTVRKVRCYSSGPHELQLQRVENPIVIVVSPLVALMDDQIKEASNLSISAAKLGDNDGDIIDGKCQLVFGSPESWLLNQKWRNMLASETYQNNLVGVVVDEVHAAYKWNPSPSIDCFCWTKHRDVSPSSYTWKLLHK